jgi:hypothetical protein
MEIFFNKIMITTQGRYANFLIFLVILLVKMGVEWKNSDQLVTRNILSRCQMPNPDILKEHKCFDVTFSMLHLRYLS